MSPISVVVCDDVPELRHLAREVLEEGGEPLLKDVPVDFISTSHGGTTPAGQGRRMLDAHFAALGA